LAGVPRDTWHLLPDGLQAGAGLKQRPPRLPTTIVLRLSVAQLIA
jgi:hypothetical protein